MPGGWRCAGCAGDNPAGTRFCGHCGSPSSGGPAVVEVLRGFVSGDVADRLAATGGVLPQERRLVTALFADLSGFTRLAGRLDTEDLLDVVDPVLRGLTDVVGRHGGTVEKFAGDALLALFGAPVTHEDDAQRALLVALEMHEVLARLTPPGVDLSLHVGITTGHVVARVIGSSVRFDYAVLGESVILAQRLESVTPAGQTWVGEATVRLAETEFDLEPLPPVHVKGRDAPLAAWRLRGERPAAPAHQAAPLLERDAALATARALVGHVAAGGRGLLEVVADRGVGATAVVHALDVGAAVRVLHLPCSARGLAEPYGPVVRLLRGLLPAPGRDGLGVLLARHGLADRLASLAPLLGVDPGAGSGPAPETPEALRRAVHEAVRDLLSAVAGGPFVVLLDGADQVDPSTLALVRSLLDARTDGAGTGVVVTSARALLGDDPLPTGALAWRARLGPLSRQAVGTLLATRLGGPVAPSLAALVAARTGGNPRFTVELARTLGEQGVLVDRGGGLALRPGAEPALPLTVEALLAARLDRLGPAGGRVVQACAVLGSPVPRRLLAAVAGDDTEPGLVELRQAALLAEVPPPPSPLVFGVAMVLEVALGRQLRRQQQALHRRVAEAAQALAGYGDDRVHLLAEHRYLAGDDALALPLLRRAADRAAGLYANDEAVRWLERAVEVARRTGAPLAGLLHDLGDLHELVGAYDAAATAYREAVALAHDVRGWRGLASVRRQQGDPAGAEDVVAEALAAVPAGDLRLLWLERSWAASVRGRPEDAVAAAERGLLGGPEDQVAGRLLLQVVRVRTLQGRDEEAVAAAEQALEVLRGAGDLRGQAGALRLLGNAHERAGRLDDAARVLTEGLALAERVGSVEELSGCLVNLGLVAQRRGDGTTARASLEQAAREFALAGNRRGLAVAWTNLAETLLAAGELDLAETTAVRAAVEAQEVGYLVVVADATATRGLVAVARGDARRGAELAEQAAATAATAGADAYRRLALQQAVDAWQVAGRPLEVARVRAVLAEERRVAADA